MNDAKDWWTAVETNWDDLSGILHRFVPTYECANHKKEFTVETMWQHILQAKKTHDGETLARYFNMAWWNAPDDYTIHLIPGWGVLCDLCSEEHVLYQEDDDGLPHEEN